MLSRHSIGTYQGNELTRNSSGSARPLSSLLAESLWTDPGLKSETGARELISSSKKEKKKEKEKKGRWGLIRGTSPSESSHVRNK